MKYGLCQNTINNFINHHKTFHIRYIELLSFNVQSLCGAHVLYINLNLKLLYYNFTISDNFREDKMTMSMTKEKTLVTEGKTLVTEGKTLVPQSSLQGLELRGP